MAKTETPKAQTPRPIRGTQDMLGGTPDSLADRFAHQTLTAHAQVRQPASSKAANDFLATTQTGN